MLKSTFDKENLNIGSTKLKYDFIILDIEGTTTSISFVRECLFPYIRKNLEEYIKTNYNNPETEDDLLHLEILSQEDAKTCQEKVIEIPPASLNNIKEREFLIMENIKWQMDNDRKSTALKQLQGHMWRDGYKNKFYTGHLFPDSAPNIKKWNLLGIKVYIYSSGSIEAQKLLFNYSDAGDLLPYLSGHFDTTIGSKQNKLSYENILTNIDIAGVNSRRVLFCTDVLGEAIAAKEAGLSAIIVKREGNEELPNNHGFPTVSNFDEINLY